MRKRGLPSPDRADGLVYSTVYDGAAADFDVGSHAEGESLTGDLMDMAW
jgi:hypothetical protein